MVDNNAHVNNLSAEHYVQAKRLPSGSLRFYCNYCERPHTHSGNYGHRVAHCIRDTPYTKGGYWLVPVFEGEGVCA